MVESSTWYNPIDLHNSFTPQPGDIIFSKREVDEPGKVGYYVKIYRDDDYFVANRHHKLANPRVYRFSKFDKILRLFKLYENWEMVLYKEHRLYLYYPQLEYNQPWYLIAQNSSKDYAINFPKKTQFSHMLPSMYLEKVLTKALEPNPRDIIIRIMDIEKKSPPPLKKCKRCKTLEKLAVNYHIPGVQHSIHEKDACPLPHLKQLQNDNYKCPLCNTLENKHVKEAKESPSCHWEIVHWTEGYEPHISDLLVRHQIDSDRDMSGALNRTHMLTEVFFYEGDKEWVYLGMDTMQFGALKSQQSIIFHPRPGDVIISRDRGWFAKWEEELHKGGYVLLHKDPGYFGHIDHGKNMWLFKSYKKEEGNAKTPRESWLVRVGFFDEFWDFHFNNQVEVFKMHANGRTMVRHHISVFPHMAQKPNYKFEENPNHAPTLFDQVEVEPNHFDIIMRCAEPLAHPKRAIGWISDTYASGWSALPRFQKEVEIHVYWSGFQLEEGDMIIRLGIDQQKDHDKDIPNVLESPILTCATIEVYVYMTGETPNCKCLFYGRDKFTYPGKIDALNGSNVFEETNVEYMKTLKKSMKKLGNKISLDYYDEGEEEQGQEEPNIDLQKGPGSPKAK